MTLCFHVTFFPIFAIIYTKQLENKVDAEPLENFTHWDRRLISPYTLLNVIFHNTSSVILVQPIIFSFKSCEKKKNAPGAV